VPPLPYDELFLDFGSGDLSLGPFLGYIFYSVFKYI